MINVLLHGACGRMGGRLVRLILEDARFTLGAAVDHPEHPGTGQDVGTFHGLAEIGLPITSDLQAVLKPGAVVIDFSLPDPAIEAARICEQSGRVALVSGTTGFSVLQLETLSNISASIPLLWSPNMSLGINLLFRLAPLVQRILGDAFDVEIMETHHRQKKDAPSGTALKLAELLVNTNDAMRFGRHGRTGERPRGEVGVHALRLGGVVGEHQVLFASDEEQVLLEHRAMSRDVFARGALAAAAWIAGRRAGLYGFDDLLPMS